MFRPTYKTAVLRNVRKHCLSSRPLRQSTVNEFQTSQSRGDIYEIKSEDDFKERVMRNPEPVIVNFHADWCEPCHSLKPLLESIVKENEGRIHLAEILVDEHASLLQTFEVTAVPAVLAIHKGFVKDKFIGLVSDQEIKTFVKNLLREKPIR